MAQIKVFYDHKGNTLTVWFGEPKREYVCEETVEEIVLMKDKSGHIIGFEKLLRRSHNNIAYYLDFAFGFN